MSHRLPGRRLSPPVCTTFFQYTVCQVSSQCAIITIRIAFEPDASVDQETAFRVANQASRTSARARRA